LLVTKDIPDEESGETAELSEIAEIGALNLRILQKLWAFRFSARAGAAARFMTSSPVLCPLAMFAPLFIHVAYRRGPRHTPRIAIDDLGDEEALA